MGWKVENSRLSTFSTCVAHEKKEGINLQRGTLPSA